MQRFLFLSLWMILGLACCARKPAPEAALFFEIEGKTLPAQTIRSLSEGLKTEDLLLFDPNLKKKKRYRALPLSAVLKRGLKLNQSQLSKLDYTLEAADGYHIVVDAEKALNPAAYLAIADLDRPEWEGMGRRKVKAGPAYLVWKQPEQGDFHEYPWPWAIIRIRAINFKKHFAAVLPDHADSSTWRGFEIFKRECLKCHTMNQKGGRIGPELNLPKNILEYRQIEQVKSYIKDPQRFRYTLMPAHEHLTEGDLDDLIAYFQHMRQKKIYPH